MREQERPGEKIKIMEMSSFDLSWKKEYGERKRRMKSKQKSLSEERLFCFIKEICIAMNYLTTLNLPRARISPLLFVAL
jgi:hypothetical protein